MSEPTLQQEIEARRPATEGTLQQIASVYIDSVAIIASAQADDGECGADIRRRGNSDECFKIDGRGGQTRYDLG